MLALLTGAGCSEDEAPAPSADTCTNGGGPVPGDADTHCIGADGSEIIQETGACMTEGGEAGAGGAAAEEPAEIRYSNSAQDDDCKYDVSFTNTCITLNHPVTFTVTVNKRTGGPLTGGTANSPEIFLESNPSHISPSNNVTAPEGPKGAYKIGPIVFDRSGRWVVRFHFEEACSDIPEDSPHAHVAFYIDVP